MHQNSNICEASESQITLKSYIKKICRIRSIKNIRKHMIFLRYDNISYLLSIFSMKGYDNYTISIYSCTSRDFLSTNYIVTTLHFIQCKDEYSTKIHLTKLRRKDNNRLFKDRIQYIFSIQILSMRFLYSFIILLLITRMMLTIPLMDR